MSALAKIFSKFTIEPATLGIENLSLVFLNVIIVAKDLQKQLSNGFQYTDIFGLLQDFPLIEQLTKVAPAAFAELKDLTPDEARELANRISASANLPNDGTVLGKVKTALALLAETYDEANRVKILTHKWQNLFETAPALTA